MRYFTLALLLACYLPSCTLLKKLKPKAPAPEVTEVEKPKPQRIGIIGLVHPDYGFVLIQTAKGLTLPEGTLLTCYSATGVQTAQLKSTPARQGNYITADITSGTPEKDNVVVHDPDGLLPQPAQPTLPAASQTSQPVSQVGSPAAPASGGPTVSASPGGAVAAPASAIAPESLLPKEAPPIMEQGLRPVPTVPLGQ